jgi:superfamily II DNA or RNA helicase
MQQLNLDLSIPKQPEKEIVLHKFQVRAKKETYQRIKEGYKRILVIALMRFGKTYLAGWMIRDANRKNKRCLVLLDRECLVSQTPDDYRDLGLDPLVYQGKQNKESIELKTAPVVIASIQTIETRIRLAKKKGIEITARDLLGDFDVIHVDEAHLVAFRDGYKHIQDTYLANGAIFIGYTGTIWRVNKKEYMGMHFDIAVIGAQPPELVADGRVAWGRFFCPGSYFDYTKLDEREGDYTDSSVEKQAVTEENLETALYNFKKYFVDANTNEVKRISLGFCVTVKHAKAICDYFTQAGYPCEFLTGMTKREERQAMYQRLKDKKTKVLFSVSALGIGLNLPFVDGILYLRPTKSQSLFFQSVCRAATAYPGKKFWMCLDFGDNFGTRFPHPLALQDYDISKPKNRKHVEMYKICPVDRGGCGEQVSKFARVCPECGYEFVVDKEEEEEELDLDPGVIELVEILSVEDQARIKWFRKLRRNAYLEETSPHEPTKLFYQKYGFEPPEDWYYKACLGKRKNHSAQAIAKLRKYFAHWQTTDYWSWTSNQMVLEFGTLQKQREEQEREEREAEAKKQREEKRRQQKEQQEQWRKQYEDYVNSWHNQFRSSTNQVHWWMTLLGIDRQNTLQEAKKAYMQLAKKYHPDTKAYSTDIADWTDEQITEKMQEINNAWEIAKACLSKK